LTSSPWLFLRAFLDPRPRLAFYSFQIVLQSLVPFLPYLDNLLSNRPVALSSSFVQRASISVKENPGPSWSLRGPMRSDLGPPPPARMARQGVPHIGFPRESSLSFNLFFFLSPASVFPYNPPRIRPGARFGQSSPRFLTRMTQTI